ncbi:MAG: hypothetical protein ACTSQO_09345 [Candidatus Helarchaeota archaeon]
MVKFICFECNYTWEGKSAEDNKCPKCNRDTGIRMYSDDEVIEKDFYTEVMEAKVKNIINISLNISTMLRNFSTRSKELILPKLFNTINKMFEMERREDYVELHDEFCKWAIKNIKPVKTQTTSRISWGQAAKIIDVATKFVFYYSNIPDQEYAKKVIKWFNSPIDRFMLQTLKMNLTSLTNIDKEKYELCQKKIIELIEDYYNNKLYPLEFDDLIWSYNKHRLLN